VLRYASAVFTLMPGDLIATGTPEGVGPVKGGDVIEITVFDLAEMNRKERVSAKGDVQLPLVGVIHVEGLSESEVAQQIAAALAQRYLKQPQVNVFVKERRSQQVAVTGAVARPGLYPLTRESYTLTDMLSEAGGLTRDAGSIVEFIPAPRGGKSTAFNAAAADPIGGSARLSNPSALQEAISIDLNELMRSGNRAMLNLPVVANDVIFVPEAGTVTVEGWVDRPGTFPLTRNSTILAALASAGGTLIASKPSAIQLLRKTAPDRSEREVIVVDADAIRAGKAADLSLRSGDVVRVPPNVFLLPAWAIYSLVQNMFSVGANIPVIP